jgi:hypothetical protein
MRRQAEYEKMSDYQPRLPSNNAYDYYITAARQLKGGQHFSGKQPPTREEVRWLEANRGAFNTLLKAKGLPYRWPFGVISYDFLLDDLARLRNLARLVNTRIRWAIASQDGMDAVHDWRIGFQMARDLQGDAVIPYLVGVAVEGIIHVPIIREMDFFSAHECREMARTLIESERTPDRFSSVIEGELAANLQTLDRFLPEQPPGASLFVMLEQLFDFELDDEEERHRRKKEQLMGQLTQLLKQPGAYQRLRMDIRREVVQAWQALADAAALPGGRYREVKLKEHDENTLFGFFVNMLSPLAVHARNYWEIRTRRRLMAAHLLLRDYCLRKGRYPDTLEPLNLQELAIDPFSGQTLVYRLSGERYLLYSVGADGKDDGGHNPALGQGEGFPRDLFLIYGNWR